MKILLTNNHLERLGGSETWVYTNESKYYNDNNRQILAD